MKRISTEAKKAALYHCFVFLCGMQIGVLIQYRKMEMGFDSFWNERLVFLVIASGLGLFLIDRAYAALRFPM